MERPTEAIEKLESCLQHDACGVQDCVYFGNYKELQEVLAWVEDLEEGRAEPAEAEMCVTMNDGKGLYLKDVDSIMLLAHKDYGITYCGTFG